MTTRTRIDLSAIALATLLVIQAGIATYGLDLVRDVAGTTRARLAAVADAAR